MSVKFPKNLADKSKKIIKNNKQNEKYGKEIEKWINEHNYCFDNDIANAINVIIGIVMKDNNDRQYLKVDGFADAYMNKDGVYCHQISRGEDWYSGELYFLIEGNEYLQMFYDC